MDWGDGEQSQLFGGNHAEELGGFRTVSHTYNATSDNGTAYEIKIAGRLMAWSFQDPRDRKEDNNVLPKPIRTLQNVLRRVLDLGDMGWVDLSHAFKGASKLVDVVSSLSSRHCSSAEP